MAFSKGKPALTYSGAYMVYDSEHKHGRIFMEHELRPVTIALPPKKVRK